MENADNVDRIFSEFIKNQVVWESFDSVLTNLGNFWIRKSAESDDSRRFGKKLEGSFSSINKAIAYI
jgi:hypothetical protein